MFWRFLVLSFLLVVPGSRIFTAATFEFQPDSAPENDKLIAKIIEELTEQQKLDNALQRGPAIQADKKGENADQQVSAQGNSQGLNLEQVEPQYVPAAPGGDIQTDKPENAAPETHAPPGKTARFHHPGPSQEEEGSKFMATDDKNFVFVCAVATVTGFIGILMAGVCYYKFRKSSKAATDVEYPAYGVTGPMKERIPSPGDRKLAQSAQMYHYQHQKQQMIAMEKANGDMKHDASDDDSEEDNVEGDYTVYECPGLAPTGEMEVKNPLFRGDETPVTPNQDITSPPHGRSSPPQNEEH
ncbi:neural proliferation differentiation and control protein 1 [Aplysia californica]|uniref:Neural proliferation differentiation and control protein 1 n=1 Tax=Aplysia californica TaxID=6500 RepID=A0ABM0J9X9_APLCA|nr:neural proliferation differentiation and control protein 1 [Aplysia californica]